MIEFEQVELLIAPLIAAVIAFARPLLEKLPRGAVPFIVVPLLGMAGEWASSMLAGADFSTASGAAFALFAIGVRNLVKNAKRSLDEPGARFGEEPLIASKPTLERGL
jgi:hypothetical protein